MSSGPKILQVPELVQGGGIGQCVDIGDRSAMDHIPHGQLGDLTADGPGDIGHLDDLSRNVMGAGMFADPPLDPGDEVFGKAGIVPQSDEEDNPDVGLPFLPNYKTLNHFR